MITGPAKFGFAVTSVATLLAVHSRPVFADPSGRRRRAMRRIGFVSANAWDAIGAKAFGFTSFWINRNRVPLDRHGPKPDAVLALLSELPPLLGSV